MNAESILSIPVGKPELLFKKKTDVDATYKSLLKEWHPDHNTSPKASEVTTHLNLLRTQATKKIKEGTWEDGSLVIVSTSGVRKVLHYKKRGAIEYGEIYYGDQTAVFAHEPANRKLYDATVSTISTLHYANDRMREEVGAYMPKLKASIVSPEGRGFVAIEKKPRVYLLRDMVAAFSVVHPDHVAWMISRALNICCYLEWANLSHGDVSTSSLFVDPAAHSLYLLGGWGYATEFGQKISFLPQRSVDVMPPGLTKADGRLDLILVRKMARELLGISGGHVPAGVPDAMVEFARSPVSGSALADYKFWNNVVLPASFDVRRFVKLEIDDSAVFKE